MKPSVYIESSVISYLTARASRDLVIAAHQAITDDWWTGALPNFEAYISPVVLAEINRGDAQAAAKRMAAADQLPILPLTADVEWLAALYFEAVQLSEKARADSYHLAIAAIHDMDYLVSWNCSHIVSGRVRRIVEGINADHGVRTPVVCTPEELMEA